MDVPDQYPFREDFHTVWHRHNILGLCFFRYLQYLFCKTWETRKTLRQPLTLYFCRLSVLCDVNLSGISCSIVLNVLFCLRSSSGGHNLSILEKLYNCASSKSARRGSLPLNVPGWYSQKVRNLVRNYCVFAFIAVCLE